jgi:hypothetical protein
MVDLPEIFSLAGAPMLGTIGPEARMVVAPPCPDCRQPYRPIITHLELLLDAWDHTDLISLTDTFAVTPDLQHALSEAGIQGVTFRQMTVGPSRSFYLSSVDDEVSMPEFVQMDVTPVLDGPSGWWDRLRECPTCNRPLWGYNERVSQAFTAAIVGQVGPPRQVYGREWKGEDVFWLTDPGPPLVTERTKAILEKFEIPELALHAAKFV